MQNNNGYFPGTLAIVGLDGQILAQSAARGGLRPVVVDSRGGADLHRWAHAHYRITPTPHPNPNPNPDTTRPDHGCLEAGSLLAAMERLCPDHACLGVVYGAGFARDPSLLRRISENKRLYGNSPETVDLASDPGAFFPMLDTLGIAHPAVGGDLPPSQGPWLLKRIGGCGGSHIHAVTPGQPSPNGRHSNLRGDRSYYQQRLSGRSLTVLLIADGQHCRVLGVSERWTIPKQHVAHDTAPFMTGGAISDAPLEPRLRDTLHDMAQALTSAMSLTGINEFEIVVAGDQVYVLEVNPYPGPTLALYDHRYPGGLFAHHLRACRGHLPIVNDNASMARGLSYVYLPGPVVMPDAWRWPWWSSNYHPSHGYPVGKRAGISAARKPPQEKRTTLRTGDHLCTVHASGENPVTVRARLRQRERELLSDLVAVRMTA